jgi:F-type H+-transporting ATPase subunit b
MKNRTRQFVLLLALALMGAMAPRRAHAQEQATTATQQTPAASQVTQEREEESGQETDPAHQLRNSPAVKWIAKTTGMSNSSAYQFCVLLNFSVVAFLILYFLRKKLPGFFKARNESLRARIDEARKTSEEARRRLQEVEGRLSRLDVEITAMRQEADDNAAAEEKRLMADAENERRRIVATAEQEISAAANNARRELKAYAAELAVDLAGKKIRVGQDADRELVRAFTSQLGKDGQ